MEVDPADQKKRAGWGILTINHRSRGQRLVQLGFPGDFPDNVGDDVK